MSTITKERLKELAAGQSGFNIRIATPEESMELARIALAAPVIPEKRSPRDMELLLDETGAEVSDQDLDLVLTLMSITWNLCRHTMLHGGKS